MSYKQNTTIDIRRLAYDLNQTLENRNLSLRDAEASIKETGRGTLSSGQLSRIIRRKSIPVDATYELLCSWMGVDPKTYRKHL